MRGGGCVVEELVVTNDKAIWQLGNVEEALRGRQGEEAKSPCEKRGGTCS